MRLAGLTMPRAVSRSLMRDRCELLDSSTRVVWRGPCLLETREQKWVAFDAFQGVTMWSQEYTAYLPLDAPRTGWDVLHVTRSRGSQLEGERFPVRGRPTDTYGVYQRFWVGRFGQP